MKNEIVIDENAYKLWLISIKKQIKHTQIKASIAVNEEMLNLYWGIGKEICERHFETQYGTSFFENLSRDLQAEFPKTQGFSATNLKYMKRFYMFYKEIRHQLGDDFTDQLFVIPWRHHVEIFTRSKSLDEALFFVKKTKQNGWSRATLINMMETKFYEIRGNGVNNFDIALPKEDSECAKEILKDKYKLDFLSLREDFVERELHDALEQNLVKFLLELGTGFAFVGSRVPLVVNGDKYECDMLFYHLKLRRYIVVELKVVKFQPEFVSKLNFYCTAVNHIKKEKNDENTIGLLICKEKNDVVAQWTVENTKEPVGISTYDLQNILPSEKEISNVISKNR